MLLDFCCCGSLIWLTTTDGLDDFDFILFFQLVAREVATRDYLLINLYSEAFFS